MGAVMGTRGATRTMGALGAVMGTRGATWTMDARGVSQVNAASLSAR
jgi:hypothetical protein